MEYNIYKINFLTEGLESKLLEFSKLYYESNHNNYNVNKDDLYSNDRIILLIKNDEDFLGYSYSKLINNYVYIKVIYLKDKYKNIGIEENIINFIKLNISKNIILDL